MPFPDFIIGGAPKCGTTALFTYLDQHPDIFTCTPKEPHFFVSREKGHTVRGMNLTLDAYESLFSKKADGQRAGEGSTGYLFHAEISAPSIHRCIPDVRLLFLLRNPIERAYSEYWFRLQRGDLSPRPSFSEYTRSADHWIFHGGNGYLDGLRAFYEQFDREQICVLLTEQLKTAPHETLRRACEHIGVDPSFSFQLTKRHNVTRYPRSTAFLRLLERLAPGISAWTSNVPALRPIRSRLLFSSTAEKPAMPSEDQHRLWDHYRSDVEALERLIGQDLSSWDPTS